MVKLPNVLITGVPGTGKSTISAAVMSEVNKNLKEKYGQSCNIMKHLQMSKLINENNLYTERDEEMDTTIFDDELVDNMLIQLNIKEGGYLIDFHDVLSCIDYVNNVFVLTTSTEVLYDRLTKRNYIKRKIETNIESLIFHEIQRDLENYPTLFKKENTLCNNDEIEMEKNIQIISNWILKNVKT